MKSKLFRIGKYALIVTLVLLFSRFVLFRSKVNAVPVRKIEVKNRVVERTISVSGEVKARKSADLTFNMSAGEIAKLYVDEGDSVARGALLAALNNNVAANTLQTYKDSRDLAIKDKEIYVENYEDDTDAVGGDDEYKLNVTRLDELISKAEAAYKAQQGLYGDSFIYAPFDGVVLNITKKEGDSSVAYEPIIKFANVEDLYFEVRLDQEDFGSIKEGQLVEISLDPFNDKTFMGKITRLPQYANGGTSPSFTVEVAFDEDQEGMLLGMTGDAKVISESSNGEVRSLLYDEVNFDEEEKPYVWTVQNKVLKRLYIDIGLEGDILTEIKTDFTDEIYAPVGDAKLEEGFNAIIQK
ncbi:MAG: efflux RND transporter periplasmic adaptor subunit [Patescibacteria group bacterium]|jgi:RND family efflux transporter MFP subunit